MTPTHDSSDVLVVGAGPTGLILAAQLARFGVRFRIIDKQLDRARESRALCDRAKQQCPIFPGAQPIHWSFDDPAEALADQQPEVFRRVRDEITQRLRVFVFERKG